MAWIDERIWCHPKVVNLSDGAFRAYVHGIAYASGFGTYGVLTPQQQRVIGATNRQKNELFSAKLWEKNGDNVVIHDWDTHNGELDRKKKFRRESERLRKQAQRQKEREARESVPPPVPQDVPRDIPPDITPDVPRENLALKSDRVKSDFRPTDGSPQNLVAWFVDQSRAAGREPPKSVVGQVAKQIGALVQEGIPEQQIRGGLRVLIDRGLHPSTLPSAVFEAQAPPKPRAANKGASVQSILSKIDDPVKELGRGAA